MVSGFERYFQIVRCFRDEDLRADRQPEFTQLDIETSFLDQDDILTLMEGLIKEIFESTMDVKIETPFKRITYTEAIDILSHDICMENDSCSLEHFIDAMTYTVKGGLSSDINYQ